MSASPASPRTSVKQMPVRMADLPLPFSPTTKLTPGQSLISRLAWHMKFVSTRLSRLPACAYVFSRSACVCVPSCDAMARRAAPAARARRAAANSGGSAKR